MPEKAEAQRMADCLEQEIGDKHIISFDYNYHSRYGRALTKKLVTTILTSLHQDYHLPMDKDMDDAVMNSVVDDFEWSSMTQFYDSTRAEIITFIVTELHAYLDTFPHIIISQLQQNLGNEETIPGYSEFISKLPLSIVDITSRGKKVIFSFSGDMHWVISLGMEGKFLKEPTAHSNMWFTLNDKSIIYFDDARHYATIDLIFNKSTLQDRLSDLGPDILHDTITQEQWLSIARNKRIQKKQIGDFLLDQKRVSGIGNYLRAEILYRAKIRPNRTLAELTDTQLEAIRLETIQTVREAYSAFGHTLKSYWDLNGEKGMFKTKVYGQSHDPLGNPVIQSTFKDGRTIHWVPAVQI